MTSSAFNNVAAIEAALNGNSEHYTDSSHTNRRSLPSKNISNGAIVASAAANFTEGHSADLMDSANNPRLIPSREDVEDGSAIADDFLPLNRGGMPSKARNRRASEGTPLAKSDGKRASGELRCEKCGKGYKHSSCLTKHLLVSSKFSFFGSLAVLPPS